MTLSLATRLVNKEKRFLGSNPCFVCFYLFDCYLLPYTCFIFIVGRSCFKIKLCKCFILLFNFVLTSYKGILQKLSVRGNPKFVSKNEIDLDSPQY